MTKQPENIDDLKDFSLKLEDAEELAKPFRCKGEPKAPTAKKDPFKDIPPSLLSADDIVKYVKETGMIAPFEQERNQKSRLKKASYEGGIGSKAYIFDPDKNEPRSILRNDNSPLVVPAHSIVFVECDLYFRLPPFIAVRFNLQIRLVHRGLLLGTGPLVDPGFWGKLCIPLHNLTDEDYVIPRDEGLIWIEFTKTTSFPKLGTPPTNRDLDDIKSAIDKACSPFKSQLEEYETQWFLKLRQRFGLRPPKTVGIRSSIQTKFLDAEKKATNAAKSAKIAEKSMAWAKRFGFVAMVGVIIGVVGLWLQFYRATNFQYEKLVSRVGIVQSEVFEIKKQSLATISRSVEGVQKQQDERLMKLNEEIRVLNKKIMLLEAKYSTLTRNSQ